MADEVALNQEKKPSTFRTALMMIVNPAGALNRQLESVNWKLTLAVPASAFGLLFFQTGLDLDEGGGLSILLLFIGIIYGGGLVTAIGWFCGKVIRSKDSGGLTDTAILSAVHLSYSAMLIYQFIGIGISLFMDWNTSVAFGVPGMLLALRPLMITLRQVTDKRALSVVLTTVVGLILLVGWSALGLIGG